GDVLDPFRHDEHLARADNDATVAKTNFHFTLEHQKYLVRVLVVVPHELPFQLDELELVVVHLGHHPRRPMLCERGKLLREIDYFGGHVGLVHRFGSRVGHLEPAASDRMVAPAAATAMKPGLDPSSALTVHFRRGTRGVRSGPAEACTR